MAVIMMLWWCLYKVGDCIKGSSIRNVEITAVDLQALEYNWFFTSGSPVKNEKGLPVAGLGTGLHSGPVSHALHHIFQAPSLPILHEEERVGWVGRPDFSHLAELDPSGVLIGSDSTSAPQLGLRTAGEFRHSQFSPGMEPGTRYPGQRGGPAGH